MVSEIGARQKESLLVLFERTLPYLKRVDFCDELIENTMDHVHIG